MIRLFCILTKIQKEVIYTNRFPAVKKLCEDEEQRCEKMLRAERMEKKLLRIPKQEWIFNFQRCIVKPNKGGVHLSFQSKSNTFFQIKRIKSSSSLILLTDSIYLIQTQWQKLLILLTITMKLWYTGCPISMYYSILG